MHRNEVVIIGATLAVLAATFAIVTNSTDPQAQLRDSVAASLTSERSSPRAFLLVQPADCDGNIAIFSVLERRSIKRALEPVVLVLGFPHDTAAVAKRLRQRGIDLPVLLAKPAISRTLYTIGYDRTPVLAVLGGQGRLRFVSPVPKTDYAQRNLTSVLTALAGAP